jgi:hypothetical protein
MKNGAIRRAIGLCLLYVGLFVVIVLVQFSRGPGLSERFGGLSVSAAYPKSSRAKAGAAPETLRVSYGGLAFLISPNSIAESLGADGAASPLALASIGKLPNGISIKLSPGVELRATAAKGPPERFTLAASAPDGVASVRLRILPSRSLRFLEKDGHRSVESSGAAYEIGLGAGSIDGGAGFLTLRPGDPGLTLARIAPVAPKQPQATAAEKFVAQAPKDPEAFKAEIAAWRDKAWSSLSGARFDADKIAWKGPDGLPVFSEKALVAYLAEALSRGSYPEALARVRGAKEKWPDKLGYASAPYMGGLAAKMKALPIADLAEARRLAQLVADKSPTIFEKEGLLRFLVDRSPAQLAQDALGYFASIDPGKLTVRQSAGFLGCAMDAKALLKDEANPFRDPGAAASRIVSGLRKTSNGFFLVTEDDGSSDLRVSLVAGTSLAAYGIAASKPALVGVGQSLVEGVLGLADAQGFSPARVLPRAAALEQRMGSIAPEELYPLVADNPYYPREVSFGRDLAPGLWAWTCAPSLVAQASASRYAFTASFPAGSAHYLVFYGIKPFANIQLYDIDYSPDNDFESYDASGYLYNREGGALYLKMKHKKEKEDIKLAF